MMSKVCVNWAKSFLEVSRWSYSEKRFFFCPILWKDADPIFLDNTRKTWFPSPDRPTWTIPCTFQNSEAFSLEEMDKCRIEIMHRYPQYEVPITVCTGSVFMAEAIRKSFGGKYVRYLRKYPIRLDFGTGKIFEIAPDDSIRHIPKWQGEGQIVLLLLVVYRRTSTKFASSSSRIADCG